MNRRPYSVNVIVTLTLTFLALATIARASTINNVTVLFSQGAPACATVTTDGSPATASCSDAFHSGSGTAFSNGLSLGAVATATTLSNGVPVGTHTNTVAQLFDTVTIGSSGMGQGSLILTYALDGTFASSITGGVETVGFVSGGINATVNGETATVLNIQLNPIDPAGSFAQTQASEAIPFTFGQPIFLQYGLTVNAQALGISSITADFSHTGQITLAQVYDGSGHLITNPTIISSDGFTYPTNSAPEPSTLLMLGSAGAGMAGVLRRKLLR